MKPTHRSSEQSAIREAATDWWIRLDSGSAGAGEKAAFARWLAADPRHGRAFDAICGLWGELDAIKPYFSQQQTVGRTRPPARRMVRLTSSLAALSLIWWLFGSLPLWLEADVRTGFGEMLDVQLSDGSIVHLNGNSALALRLDERHRELALLEGEAWFEVQPDAARPFRVKAGRGTVTALGTAFNIRLRGSQTEVSVTEHRVAVDLMRGPADGPTRRILDQNQQIRFDANTGFGAVERIDGANATAWRRGVLVFQDRPLGEVIAELNRYYQGYLMMSDAGLAQRRVNGVFRTDQPLAVLAALETSLHVKSIRLGSYLIWLHR